MKYILLFLFLINVVYLQDIYKNFNFLDKFFRESLNSLAREKCPIVGDDGKKYCPNTEVEILDSCDAEDGDVFSTELITFDTVTREIRYPVIDLEKSRVIETTHSKQKKNYFNDRFSNVNEYFDNYLAFDGSKPFRNGKFQHADIKDMVQFFYDNFGNGKNADFTISQAEIINLEKEVKKENIVLNKVAQEIIDVYLPDEYNEEMYAKFVEEFGTVVARKCNYGGIVEQELFLKSCLKSIVDPKVIDEGLKKDLERIINNPSGKREGDDNYIRKSQVKSKSIYGGNPLIDEYKERIATFPSNPVVTSCEFFPIYDIIKDANKKRNLKMYLEMYLQTPKKQRDEAFAQCEEEKQKQYLKEPMPICLVSNPTDKKYEFEPIKLNPGQMTTKTFTYGQVTKTFYCECDSSKKCKCYMSLGQNSWISDGNSDLGLQTYSWKVCHRCSRCVWTRKCCCDHYNVRAQTYGVINCELVEEKSGVIVCTCVDF